MEHTLMVYMILCLVSLWGTILFTEELYQKWEKPVSAVFLYVLVLLIGFVIILAINTISRYYTLQGDFHILHSWYWPYRWYLTGVGIVGIVGHMTYRRFFEK